MTLEGWARTLVWIAVIIVILIIIVWLAQTLISHLFVYFPYIGNTDCMISRQIETANLVLCYILP